MGDAPAWLGAIGTVGSFVALLVLWRIDRRRAKEDEARREKDYLRRLIAGLRAEIQLAIEAAFRQQHAIERTLSGIQQARQRGAEVIDRGPPMKGSMVLTDAIIYREVAAEIGRLPPDVVQSVATFYSFSLELGRLAEMATSALSAYETLQDLTPRLRMHAAMTIRMLDKFEKSDFTITLKLLPEGDEVRELAKQVGYPIDEILKERGLAP